jgi:hypothetical protein
MILISITCIYSNIRELKTPSVNYDNGNILRLAELNVECYDNEVLLYWRVVKGSGIMHIEYKCLLHPSVSFEHTYKVTNWNSINSDKRKSLNYLDRHDIDCDVDQAIGAFQMEIKSSQIRFKYRCNTIQSASLSIRNTAYENVNFGEIQNLDVHPIFGSDRKSVDQVLRGWRMRTKYQNRWCTVFCENYQFIKFEIIYYKLKQQAKIDFKDFN